MSTDSCICRYIGPDNEKKWRDARTHLLNAHERICELKAEVERLKKRLDQFEWPEVHEGGGRESGAKSQRGVAEPTSRTRTHEGSGYAAANPAARCDACWEGRSHTHDARKEASP